MTFIGGTLISLGGHSLIEPALEGSPLAFGPSIDSSLELAERLISKGAGFKVQDADALAGCLTLLLNDPERQRQSAQAAQAIAESFRGASNRTLEEVKKRGLSPF